ncbi:hypothetical protein F5Y13DRAFT_92113 [Hypoxylon sp. FL1857]|nr:hypothetical protein F5Y13DRAFT_92113 [Hypoxylon sp. FL1857]
MAFCHFLLVFLAESRNLTLSFLEGRLVICTQAHGSRFAPWFCWYDSAYQYGVFRDMDLSLRHRTGQDRTGPTYM